ncbi:type VII secretion protein EccE [Streptomyces griseocarneus]|uniref:type VII secretion protein EccE n=1 Tax=Streptomyces griseocarneus TaxID=51201 RepID=UPI00167EF79A|nr:type VII secretion protein EccE [Streptomyces griseocarneus]MBZ6478061.1 type VII secretion protein EccE [Streptomyces griseocarneus]GHG55098.1 type VII secretion protein EccE [Streptomyces griseocarneus]
MAVATRVRAAAGPETGADAVAPRPAPGRRPPGPVGLRQLVLVEVAAAVVVTAWATARTLLAPAVVLAVVLVLLALVRRGRRPVTEWLASAVALRLRAGREAAGPPAAGTDPRLAPLVECEPALRTDSFAVHDDRTLGLVGDGTFLTAVLRLEAVDRPLRADRVAGALPLGLLRDALDIDDIRLESAQVVQTTLPSPAPDLPAGALPAANYAPLQALTGSPAVRQTWVALKFDPELCPAAVAARGGGTEGARRCLLRAVDQLASRLRGAGFAATPLTEDGLTAALAAAADLNAAATDRAALAPVPARRTAESARAWRCDDRWHTTYWVSRWPRLGGGAAPLPQLAALLTSLPALSTTLSLTLGRGRTVRGRHAPTMTGHIRICGRSADELHGVGRELERAAKAVRAGLVRLDQEQVPGVLATLPLGGTR